MILNASPTVCPNDCAPPAAPVNRPIASMTDPNTSVALLITSNTTPNTSIHAWNTPVDANDCTKPVTHWMPLESQPMSWLTRSMTSASADAAVLRSCFQTPLGSRLPQSVLESFAVRPSHAVLRVSMAPMSLTRSHNSENWFLVNVTMLAAASPILPNCELNPLIAPAMFSTPNASMTFCTALATRFFTFSMAVPMPCVASLACCANEAYWPNPFSLRSTMALLKSSKL